MGRQGQSLIEILVALGVGVLLIGGVTALIGVDLRSSTDIKISQSASSLTQEVIDGAKSQAESDWNAFYALAKGTANPYYISSSTQALIIGKESIVVNGVTFSRYFYVDNVNKTMCGTGVVSQNAPTGNCGTGFPRGASDIAEDPSTQRITAVVEWAGGHAVAQTQFVSRTKNIAIKQTDWSAGGGNNGIVKGPGNDYASATSVDATSLVGSLKVVLPSGGATGTPNVDATNHWAWNDVIGWIDFATPGTAGLTTGELFGYASSSVGYIAFSCDSTPNGNICSGPSGNWKVSNNGGGTLTGWAYNDAIGWISFDSGTSGSLYSYGVTVDASGVFTGYAWNDVIGWISFNCSNTGTCGAVSYGVKTGWVATPVSGNLTSPIFDLGSNVALNAVIWKGSQNLGSVAFQIATSATSTGPWNYLGPGGTSGSTDVYSVSSGNSATLNPIYNNNIRYARYKVIINSDNARSSSPQVDDIILNYSL